jgi:hypothetical protein
VKTSDVSVKIEAVEGQPNCVLRFDISCQHGHGVTGKVSKMTMTAFGPVPAGGPPPTRAEVIRQFLMSLGKMTGHDPSCDCWAVLAAQYGPDHEIPSDPACPIHGLSIN